MITVDAASANLLLEEGALCLDVGSLELTETGGRLVDMPDGAGRLDRPILVCGADDERVVAVVEALSRQGLPAWRVSDAGTGFGPPACGCATGSPG